MNEHEPRTDQGQPRPQEQPGKVYVFDKPKNVKRVIRGLLAVCAILLGLDAVIHRHHDHPWESMFGFYPVYGFLACVTLVLLAKELRKLVMRSENYYDPYYRRTPDADDSEEGRDA
jgi:hypothetical protein